ncbi:hypothetical protein [Sinorhizobium meliloti]|nr:hypothetical protein CN163_27790 [Sinorhizobium meliloti]
MPNLTQSQKVRRNSRLRNFDSKNPDTTQPIPEGGTYTQNAPNSWSVASYDPRLGLIYFPMGNESLPR